MSSPEQTETQTETETKVVSRRGFVSGVTGAALLPFLSGVDTTARAQTPFGESPLRSGRVQSGADLIIRQREPENLEFDFSSLDSFLTPNDRFYVRTHFATPTLEADKWQLRVEGAVKRPFTLTYDELRKLPSRKVQATLECAGNGRVYLTPPARGVQWERGAVSTAEWTGVPLSALLEQAGLNPRALEVVLEGADGGEIKDPPHPAGSIRFARSLPLAKAQNQDVLIAYRMNDAPLPVAHGFPVRAIVPGWYGVASVKWLTRILVLSQPFQGHFQTIDYAYWQRIGGLPTRVPITEMLVKASIARPAFRETIAVGSTYRIRGAAWAGDAAIAKVEISVDSGKSWELARLQGPSVSHTWRLWEHEWRAPASPGRYTLMARATDAQGNAQPMQRDPDRENYMVNHVVPIEVDVR